MSSTSIQPDTTASLLRPTSAALFLLFAMALAYGSVGDIPNTLLLLASTLTGGYLALTIGANDAANNIATTVGAGALTLSVAMLLAAAGELAGAFLASDPVSTRLKEGLFDLALFDHCETLARVLLAGMLAAAVWLHLATFSAIPVSTTHSVIGSLLGAGIAAHGWSAVYWREIASIASVWVASPLLAALLAGLMLYLVKRTITYKPNLLGAARTRVPVLIALLALVFSNYFFTQLAPEHWHLAHHHIIASLAVALAVFLVAQPRINSLAQVIKESEQGVNRLFTAPMVLAAIFFSFTHGANDVANVAGPLSFVATIATDGSSPQWVVLPPWALAVSGLGIAVGLAAYGSRMVRTVGSEITEIDNIRGFCIAFSAAMVVLLASHFGFPVSTTHTLVGGIFGVGLLRERLKIHEQETLEKIRKCYADENGADLTRFLNRFQRAGLERRRAMLEELRREHGELRLTPGEIERVEQLYHRRLVKRSLFRRIIIFWILTIPATGLLGALTYGLLQFLEV